jgi:hypothetical protein
LIPRRPRLRTAAAALAAAAALLAPLPARAADASEGPRDRYPRAGAAYLVERGGAVLWARNPDAPRPPASLTKLMTALLAAERGGPDAWVTVSARAARETGARLGLRAGERIRAGDALAATLVASANDACLALSEHVGGTAERFVEAMNARAAALGLAATRFENPCGHDAPGHRSSARDLLALTRAFLAVPALALLAAAAAGLALLRRHPAEALALLWTVGWLPVAGLLVPRAELANDRQLYCALLGPAWLAARAVSALAATRRRWALGAAAAGLATLGLATVARNGVYADEVRFWEAALARSPGSARAWNNLGFALAARCRREEAEAAFLRAGAVAPGDYLPRVNLRLLRAGEPLGEAEPRCPPRPGSPARAP